MRLPLSVLMLSLNFVTGSVIAASPVVRTIDLDTSAGRHALQQSGVAHQQKVAAILAAAERQSCDMLPKVIPAQFAIDDARCENFLLMTSDPPKRRLEFTLDQTRYTAVIRLVSDKGGVIPAK